MVALPPLRPSAPIRIKYEARILALVDEMQTSLVHWLSAEYRRNEPEVVLLGQDRSPAAILSAAIKRLSRRWQSRFDELAPKMADYFATAVKDRCDRTLKADLRKAGMTVRFTLTPAMRDAFDATRVENVSLIKSVAAEHLAGVETLVMRSVTAGRDLATLAQGLQKRHGVTKRRAALIARDQNNKATATMQRVRHLELGITEAKWLHSAGGKTPRPEHVSFSGQRYSIKDGHDFDDGEGPVWPGTAINCRCVSVPIIPGFDD